MEQLVKNRIRNSSNNKKGKQNLQQREALWSPWTTGSKSSPAHWEECWCPKNSHPHPTDLGASRENRREPHNSLALCPGQLK